MHVCLCLPALVNRINKRLFTRGSSRLLVHRAFSPPRGGSFIAARLCVSVARVVAREDDCEMHRRCVILKGRVTIVFSRTSCEVSSKESEVQRETLRVAEFARRRFDRRRRQVDSKPPVKEIQVRQRKVEANNVRRSRCTGRSVDPSIDRACERTVFATREPHAVMDTRRQSNAGRGRARGGN